MGFVPEEGTTGDRWICVVTTNGTPVADVKVDLDEFRIEYPASTKLGRTTCLNLHSTSGSDYRENLVTLDCYVRLLRAGYAPHHIELEKELMSGRGWADLVVYSADSGQVGNVHMIVECKAGNAEHDQALGALRSSGGQLMLYWGAHQEAKTLCLYSSEPNEPLYGAAAAYRTDVLLTNREVFAQCRSSQALFGAWDQQFDASYDVFGPPYDLAVPVLKVSSLSRIDRTAADRVFLDILELLRLYSVSDKQNAFMKIINLLIAKVYDETDGDSTYSIQTSSGVSVVNGLLFQVTTSDTFTTLHQRLLHLYTRGMSEYLQSSTFHSERDFMKTPTDELEPLLKLTSEFHFVEVYDADSYRENAKIVSGVVKVLQPYRFRNDDRDQILGDLFERLLNTAIKQESGQYFTPMPLVDFMTGCLPLEAIIRQNVIAKRKVKTPYVIDYSCGSGHFIIAALEAVHRLLRVVDTPETRRLVEGGYDWAGDSIYGIEKDYRLAKTTKINTFLNGDGQANILHADGLEPFDSPRYTGVLHQPSPRDNGKFDVVLANPPYSVDGFIKAVGENRGEETFTLFGDFGIKSTEIETLFIERTAQLLREGGFAAIVLPTSVVNSHKYVNLRRFLFGHFAIRAVLYLGTNTFSDTTTSPVILFLEHKTRNDYRADIRAAVRDGQDRTLAGLHQPVSTFLRAMQPELSFESLHSLLVTSESQRVPNAEEVLGLLRSDAALNVDLTDLDARALHDFCVGYVASLVDKINLFLGTYGEWTISISAPTHNIAKERAFLGYRFSKSRNKSGIEILEGSPLYSVDNPEDPDTFASLIREYLASGEVPTVNPAHTEAGLVSVQLTSDLIEFAPPVSKRSSVQFPYTWNERVVAAPRSSERFVYLRDIVEAVDAEHVDGPYTSIKIGDIAANSVNKTEVGNVKSTRKLARAGDILIPYLMPAPGKVVRTDRELVMDSAIEVLRPVTPEVGSALFAYLSDAARSQYFYAQVGQKLKGFKKTYQRVSAAELLMVKIPVGALGKLPDDVMRLVRDQR